MTIPFKLGTHQLKKNDVLSDDVAKVVHVECATDGTKELIGQYQ